MTRATLLALCLTTTIAATAGAQRATARQPAMRARLARVVKAYHDAGRFDGAVLVARGGVVLYEGGVGEANREWHTPNAPAVPYRIASTTKQFTAALVLRLVEEGKLRLDGRIVDYLPGYPRPQGEQVTLHHLLSHSSGIPNYVAVPGFYRDVGPRPHTPAELVAMFSARPLAFAPGTRWDYSNSNYVLLGAIVERVTGETWADALRARVLAPLGLADTDADDGVRVVPRRASGYLRDDDGRLVNAIRVDPSNVYAAGILRATVRDLFRWSEALRAGRVVRDTALAARLTTPHVATGTPLGGYGYGVFVGDQTLGGHTVRVVQHGGTIPGFTAGFWRIPADGVTIVVLANVMGPGATELTRALAETLYGGD